MNRVWATAASYFGPVVLAQGELVECFEKRQLRSDRSRKAAPNARNGTAKNWDYDVPVWRDIERYLNVYRPMLPDANKVDYVLLSSMDE